MPKPLYKSSQNNQTLTVLDELSKLTDEELVKAFNDLGDSRFFELIYHRYRQKVRNICYKFVKNTAEVKDMTQDIFLKLFLKLKTYKEQSKFSTWLYSFTHNYCVNHLQRVVRKREMLMTSALDDNSSFMSLHRTEDDLDEELHEMKIFKLINTLNGLNPPDKAILQLKYIERKPVKKIQELLNIQASAVKMRLKRARLKLHAAHQIQTLPLLTLSKQYVAPLCIKNHKNHITS